MEKPVQYRVSAAVFPSVCPKYSRCERQKSSGPTSCPQQLGGDPEEWLGDSGALTVLLWSINYVHALFKQQDPFLCSFEDPVPRCG